MMIFRELPEPIRRPGSFDKRRQLRWVGMTEVTVRLMRHEKTSASILPRPAPLRKLKQKKIEDGR